MCFSHGWLRFSQHSQTTGFAKHRSLPKAEFVLRLSNLSSTDPEPLSEIKPMIFVSLWVCLVFFFMFTALTQYLVKAVSFHVQLQPHTTYS